MGLVAPQHVGSSQTRARTRVPCTGRWIPNHCATREAPRSNHFVGHIIAYLLAYLVGMGQWLDLQLLHLPLNHSPAFSTPGLDI